jgi:hypothetical protein
VRSCNGGELEGWRVVRVASCKVASCQGAELSEWRVVRVASWKVTSCKVASCQGAELSEWRVVRVASWKVTSCKVVSCKVASCMGIVPFTSSPTIFWPVSFYSGYPFLSFVLHCRIFFARVICFICLTCLICLICLFRLPICSLIVYHLFPIIRLSHLSKLSDVPL